jgi:hypothetical protein
MVNMNLGTTISKRIKAKMDKLAQRLAELKSDETIEQALAEVIESIEKAELQLQEYQKREMDIDTNAVTRLEIARDRLLVKKERLELKLELMQDRRERLQDALEMQKEAYTRTQQQSRADVRIGPPHRQPSTYNPKKLQDERKRILEMLQVGKITTDEAMKLIDALQLQSEKAQEKKHKPRWVRIRVTDVQNNRIRVNLTLPVGLVRAGLRTGGNIAGMEDFDIEGLEDMLNRGETGHFLDVMNEEEDSRVEIFIE